MRFSRETDRGHGARARAGIFRDKGRMVRGFGELFEDVGVVHAREVECD